MSSIIFLGLGTNKGDRENHLRQARKHLSNRIYLLAESSIYETPPWGYKAQSSFLNQVLKISSNLSPQDLLILCKDIESNVGRSPTFRYGPREIDIDILSYGEIYVNELNLKIPHAELHNRAFMLIPLKEIEPMFTHPTIKQGIDKMISLLPPEDIEIYVPTNREENAT